MESPGAFPPRGSGLDEHQRTVALLSALGDPAARAEVAWQLAVHIGADDLGIFVHDDRRGAFVPAQGFEQMQLAGSDWLHFLARCITAGRHREELVLRGRRVPVQGIAAGDGAVLALFGGKPRAARLQELEILLPLLARLLEQEHLTRTAQDGERNATAALQQSRAQVAQRDDALAASEAARQELKQLVDSKDEFLTVISHELRTPLTSIYTGTRVLRARGRQLDETVKGEVLEEIEREADRMYRLVLDLLVLARLDLGEQPALEPVLVQRLITSVAKQVRERRPARLIESDIEPGLPPVAADSTFLEQVLLNLLINADTYSPAAAPITLRARRDDAGGVVISVRDEGIGIDPDETEKIFDRFYRSRRTSKAIRGLGIGLTVCRRLVEVQAGRIWAETRADGGIEISFTLNTYPEDD